MRSPEELARQNIDKLITDCGWIIQKRSEINLSVGPGSRAPADSSTGVQLQAKFRFRPNKKPKSAAMINGSRV